MRGRGLHAGDGSEGAWHACRRRGVRRRGKYTKGVASIGWVQHVGKRV